jgi:hypothetical protein
LLTGVTRIGKFAIWILAGLCLITTALLLSEHRENARLRLELLHESEQAKRMNPPKPSDGATRTVAEGPAAAVVTRIPAAELERTLLQIIQSRLWRTDYKEERRLLGLIGLEDMPRAMLFVDRNAAGKARSQLRFDLLRAWTKLDPRAAAENLARFSPNELRTAREIVCDTWAEQDPVGALAFAGPTETVLSKLAFRSPEKAVEVVMALPSGARASAINTVARAWFEKDPVAAWKWARELPEADRFFGVRPLIQPLADVDPAAVGAYLAAQPARSPFRNLAEGFAQQWTDADPPAAAAWAAGLATSSACRTEAIAGVAQEWAGFDPKAAAAWIDALPGRIERDLAISRFVNAVLTDDPATAAQMAIKASDEQIRGNAIASVASRWLNVEPTAARAWLNQIVIPESAKKRLGENGFHDLPGGGK